jgi:hypothetical protein
METLKKYIPFAGFAAIVMYAFMLLEVAVELANKGTANPLAQVLSGITIAGFIKGFGFFLVIFFICFGMVLIAKKISSRTIYQLLLAGLAFSAIGALLFTQGTQMNPIHYFPKHWLIDFQFFAISYAFIRIADVKANRQK